MKLRIEQRKGMQAFLLSHEFNVILSYKKGISRRSSSIGLRVRIRVCFLRRDFPCLKVITPSKQVDR